MGFTRLCFCCYLQAVWHLCSAQRPISLLRRRFGSLQHLLQPYWLLRDTALCGHVLVAGVASSAVFGLASPPQAIKTLPRLPRSQLDPVKGGSPRPNPRGGGCSVSSHRLFAWTGGSPSSHPPPSRPTTRHAPALSSLIARARHHRHADRLCGATRGTLGG